MKRSNILLTVLALLFVLSSCESEDPFPHDGIWYCAELQAQFTMTKGDTFVSPDDEYFVDESENYIIVNGDRIAAGLGSNFGATYVWIGCQEPDRPVFNVGEIIYSFEFVSLSDTEYVLEDDTGKQYTFLRIGDTPTEG